MRVVAVVLLTVLLTTMVYGEALQHLSVPRDVATRVDADSQAVFRLSPGFAGGIYTFSTNGRYQQVGTVQNAAQQSAQVVLTVDPLVEQACLGPWCILPAPWTLFFCWSPTTNPRDTTTCTGGQELRFPQQGVGWGGQDPNPGGAQGVSLPPGSTYFLFVRIASLASRFCGQASLKWELTYPGVVGSVGGPLGGNPDGSRVQYYRIGSGC